MARLLVALLLLPGCVRFTRVVAGPGSQAVTESGVRATYGTVQADLGGGQWYGFDGSTEPELSLQLTWYDKPFRVWYRGQLLLGGDPDHCHVLSAEVEW